MAQISLVPDGVCESLPRRSTFLLLSLSPDAAADSLNLFKGPESMDPCEELSSRGLFEDVDNVPRRPLENLFGWIGSW